jgi:hypothetical protein
MADNYVQQTVRFEEIIPENIVAMIRQEPAEISKLAKLEFRESWDDLDYLTFAILSLPSNNEVALVRHQCSPEPGTEICVSHNQQNVAEVIEETLNLLNLTSDDLTWVHPDYEQIYKSRKSPLPSKEKNQPKNFSGIDFSNLPLKKIQLERANLRKTIFKQAELGMANLQHADLREANLEATDLRGADFRGADLRGASLHGSCFEDADLEQANLDKINLDQTTKWFHVIGLHKAKGIPTYLKEQSNYKYYIKLSEGIEKFKQGNLEEFQEIYKQVLVELQDSETIASLWNKIAWLSVLYSKHFDRESYEAALKAVELKPDKGNYHDTLGIVLALKKDFNLAIEEFEIALKSEDVQKWTEEFKEKRKRWIKSLESGENPFTTEELKILLDVEY